LLAIATVALTASTAFWSSTLRVSVAAGVAVAEPLGALDEVPGPATTDVADPVSPLGADPLRAAPSVLAMFAGTELPFLGVPE
jgi:hypothetical protein